MHNTFKVINKWFKANLLSSNYAKTQCVQFRTKNAMQIDGKIIYGNNFSLIFITTTMTISTSLVFTCIWIYGNKANE